MPAPQPDSDVLQCAIRLRSAVTRLSRQLRSGLQRNGLSAASLSLLGQLHRFGPMTPTELAGREKVRLQSLTRLLAELESAGWLERAPHADDGRRSLVSLSAKGRRRLADAAQAGEASIAKTMATALSAAQRTTLFEACALLETLADTMDRQPGAKPEQDEPMATIRSKRP